MKKKLPLIVSLTTMPSRIGLARPTIESLFAQTRPPDRIYMVLPLRCDREPEDYVIPEWVASYAPRLEVIRCELDYGPGTKLLGCLSRITEPSCLVLVDDDMAYQPEFLTNLYAAQTADPASSFSFYVYSWGTLQSIGQGADGFSIYTPHLKRVLKWGTRVIRCPQLRVHDDLWISAYLQMQGVAVKNLRKQMPGLRPAYKQVHNENQLQHLTGELARATATERGAHWLVAHGFMGRWLQADHHARRLIKHCLALVRQQPKMSSDSRPPRIPVQ